MTEQPPIKKVRGPNQKRKTSGIKESHAAHWGLCRSMNLACDAFFKSRNIPTPKECWEAGMKRRLGKRKPTNDSHDSRNS